ncbi:alpha/beta fold hydrolase [Leptothrix discophora]|uniref:Alpha/beta hydrolase n=1 Tax=Leptothrix discophora TaxID=89 RepID=A0ABT9FZ88_LEPDI|nr:alpha/beta hydrolase [Leptothrix discophora]MDP4299542.1 alpha/beta hydrolase [Leptothrix discophora]
MPEPRLHHVDCLDSTGLHRMGYWEWGESDNPDVVVCVHGLSRQGRDFDTLACTLAPRWRVVCPDVVGRGQSDWLADPMGYQVPAYVADMVTLIARLDVPQVSWVGTSMGGLIGMGLASLRNSPVRRLVLNDVGPVIEYASLQRIGTYLGAPVRFADEAQGAAFLRGISASFGPHTDEQWAALSRPQFKHSPEGDLIPHYDPAIAAAFKAVTPEIAKAGERMLWAAYDRIQAPTLLLRGAESDLLSPATAQAMTERGPKAMLVEFGGVGHAPTLVAPDQVASVVDFLEAGR